MAPGQDAQVGMKICNSPHLFVGNAYLHCNAVKNKSLMNPLNLQLEKIIETVLKSGDVRVLDAFFQGDRNKETLLKCSGQFLKKVDQLVNRVR